MSKVGGARCSWSLLHTFILNTSVKQSILHASDCERGLYREGLFPCSPCLNTFSQVGLVLLCTEVKYTKAQLYIFR